MKRLTKMVSGLTLLALLFATPMASISGYAEIEKKRRTPGPD